MKVCTCFLLFEIFAFTNSASQLKLHAALEAVTAGTDERSGGTKNLDNDDNFTANITDKNKNLKLVFRAPKVEIFTDFIQETVDILNVFEDNAFEDFFNILDNEIRNYHYDGCKFSELTEDRDTRSLLTRTLKTIRRKPVTFIKAYINELADKLRDETYDNSVKKLLDFINSLYKHSKKKFHRFLNNLNHYRKKSAKTHNDLVQIIRDGVQTILFNHYSELDTNTRRELIEIIETFWKKFKKIPNSNGEINHVGTDPVHEPIIKSSEVSENEINKVKEPELHFKHDPQKNLKNKRGRIVSKEAYDDHSKDKEVEYDLSSNESGKQATDYTAEELSSRQSFDSSSNSIKISQERQEEYNTQRYMTLYTEEISYKARTTKETKITPMSKNVMTRKHKDHRRSTTTPRYRSRDVIMKKILRTNPDTDDKKEDIDPNLRHDSHELRARPHSAQQREPRKPEKSRSKSRHKNAQIYSQYDAVIDVRLDNPDLLESLRMFAPAAMVPKHNTSPYPRPVEPRRTKTESRPQSPTAPTKSPLSNSISFDSHHITPVNESRRRISPSTLNLGPRQHMKDNKTKRKSPTRRSGNDTKDFNEYVIKRIDALENDLKQLKQMHNVPKVYENNTDEIPFSNVTAQRKDMKDFDIERFSNTNQDLDNKDVIKENNTDYNTNSNESNADSSATKNNTSVKPDYINIDALNATVIENKTTTEVTDNNTNTNTTDTNETSKEANTKTVTFTDSTTDVTDTTTVKSDDTTPTAEVPRRTMDYSKPVYYDYPYRQIDPFDHINDGLDLNM